MRNLLFAAIVASVPLVSAHQAFFDPSMWGYNVSMQDFPYDNRPMAPLQQYTFDQWWFHGHLKYEPEAGKFFELTAGGTAISQLACNKGATKWWAASEGTTDIRQGGYPCPGYPLSQFHTNGIDDLKGCALSIAYTSDVNSIQPEDLAVFSVNHQCVWTVDTAFQVPQDMPPCPEGGCICAWHWIHSVDSGSAQMFMNGFRCKVTGSTSNSPIQKPQVPKRCTGDISKCNQGAQQPLYWFQAERNNMFNDQYDPPYYLDEWGFTNGAQNGIFEKDGSNTPVSSSSSSTPMSSSSSSSSTPPYTPLANNQPSPTPVPTPTPGNNPPQNNSPPQNNYPPQSNNPPQGNNSPQGNGGNGNNPSPPPSPTPPQPSPYSSPERNNAPAPSPPPNNGVSNPSSNPQGNGNNGSEFNDPTNPQPPSPSGSQRCRPRNGKNGKKRQLANSRHFNRHKRHVHGYHH